MASSGGWCANEPVSNYLNRVLETHLQEKYRIVSVDLKYDAKMAGSVSDCGMQISLHLNFFSVSPLSQK